MLLAEQSEAVRGEGGDQEDDQQPVGRSGELPDEPPSERRRPLGDGQHPRGTRQRHRRDLHVGPSQMVEGKGVTVRPASGHYASAINLARLATLGLHHAPTGSAIA